MVPAASPSPPTVYLVDDDPAVLNSLTFLLRMEGYAVHAFETGEALLAAAPEQHDACLVVDYKLPGRNGLDIVALLRSAGFTTPAILMTSAPPAAVRMRAQRADVPIVEKPFVEAALIDAIRAAVTGSPPGKANGAHR